VAEPAIVELAQELCNAAQVAFRTSIGSMSLADLQARSAFSPDHDGSSFATHIRRAWLAVAIKARPDLAKGAKVPRTHWAAIFLDWVE